MPIARVASVLTGLGRNGGTSASIDTTGANLIVVGVAGFYGVASTLSDSRGNTWTALALPAGTSNDPNTRLWYSSAPAVGAGHTFSVSGSDSYSTVFAAAYSGAATSGVLDAQNSAANNGAPTSLASGSVTPSADGAVIVSGLAVFVNATNPTVSGGGLTRQGFSNAVANNTYTSAFADEIQTTATARTATWSWTTGARAVATIAAFKAAAGPTSHATTGALTGAGAATAGAAARSALHSTSGALTGSGAATVGAASRQATTVTHSTSGTLAGDGGAVVGTAAHLATHSTSGGLSGSGAQVSGAAVGAGGSVGAGGDDDKPRKRRYIVQEGRRLLVFDNRAEAIKAERTIEQAREAARKAIANAQTKTQARKTAKRAAQTVSKALDAALLAPPAEVVSLDAIQASVAPYPQAMAALQSAMRLRDAEAMFRAWQDMRDDEEDIAAILEMI